VCSDTQQRKQRADRRKGSGRREFFRLASDDMEAYMPPSLTGRNSDMAVTIAGVAHFDVNVAICLVFKVAKEVVLTRKWSAEAKGSVLDNMGMVRMEGRRKSAACIVRCSAEPVTCLEVYAGMDVRRLPTSPTRSFQMVMICEPGSIILASVL
jgi:hypothetical protein